MIDAGLSEAAALIVFKTAYLSYECFIQETKYELAGREPPQERRGNGRLMHANNGLREGGRGKEGKEKEKAVATSSILWLPYLLQPLLLLLASTLSVNHSQFLLPATKKKKNLQ